MNEKTGGFGFLGLLTLIFITLKLTGVIGWSWWYVLMPMYLPLAIALVICLLVVLFVALKEYRK